MMTSLGTARAMELFKDVEEKKEQVRHLPCRCHWKLKALNSLVLFQFFGYIYGCLMVFNGPYLMVLNDLMVYCTE